MQDRDLGSFGPSPPPSSKKGGDVDDWKLEQSRLIQKYAVTSALREQREFIRERGEDQKNLERAISAYRGKDYLKADSFLYEVKEVGRPGRRAQISLLYSLLPNSGKSEDSRERVEDVVLKANRKAIQLDVKYGPNVMEKTYSEIADILMIYGAMKPEDKKAADVRARVKRSMNALKFPG